jgi:hypothetical protein
MFFLEKCKEKTFAIVLSDIESFNIKKDEIVFIEKIKYIKKKRFCSSIRKDGSCFNIFDDKLKSIDQKKSNLELDENHFLEMKIKNNEIQFDKSVPVICEILKELENYWHVKIIHNQIYHYFPKNAITFQKKEELPFFTTIKIVPWYYKKITGDL